MRYTFEKCICHEETTIHLEIPSNVKVEKEVCKICGQVKGYTLVVVKEG